MFGNDHLENREGNGRITLRCVLGRQVVKLEVDGTGSGSCPMVGLGSSYPVASGSAIGDLHAYIKARAHIGGPFEKFLYSESELCGGAVTVSFSKYLPWQAMHFSQRSTHFQKTCCRPFAASFRRIVEQAVLTIRVRFSISKSASTTCTPQLVSLHRLHGLDGWVAGFRIQSHNTDAPLRKYLVAPPS
jgi:hypothetical protein